MSDDLKSKLQGEAQLAIFAHRISEKQEKNMKMYPFVFFEGVTSVKIDYDLGHGVNEEKKEINHNSHVTYYLALDESLNEKALDKRYAATEAAVRAIFWKDVKVKIYFNDNLKYESKNA